MYTNQNNHVTHIRRVCKRVGLTFKQGDTKRDGVYLWIITNRKTGDIVIDNCTFASAFEYTLSGYISSWDGERFKE